jgi:hypothetical protein
MSKTKSEIKKVEIKGPANSIKTNRVSLFILNTRQRYVLLFQFTGPGGYCNQHLLNLKMVILLSLKYLTNGYVIIFVSIKPYFIETQTGFYIIGNKFTWQ